MQARLIRQLKWNGRAGSKRTLPDGYTGSLEVAPAGTVIEDHNCYMLVRMGVAVPADDECTRAANMSEEQLTAAQKAYPRLEAGITQEDLAAYDAGLMTGYDNEGDWIPGPNAPDDAEDLELDDDDEDDQYEENEDDE